MRFLSLNYGFKFIFLLLLLCLLGGFPIRNSDLWHHLALGRLLAQGDYQYGVDPFSYLTASEYWTNHSWLWDLGIFRLYQHGGDFSLVLFRLIVSSIFLLIIGIPIFRISSWNIFLFSIPLLLIAISPYLLFQSTLISYLGLSILFLIIRSQKYFWFIPILMIVWANLDQWFVLGLLSITVVWICQHLNRSSSSDRNTPITSGKRLSVLIMVISWSSCLINPHTYHVFELPDELHPSVLTSSFPDDPRFQSFFDSALNPLRYVYFARGLNPAGIAFLVILAISLLTFVIEFRRGEKSTAKESPFNTDMNSDKKSADSSNTYEYNILVLFFVFLVAINHRLIPFLVSSLFLLPSTWNPIRILNPVKNKSTSELKQRFWLLFLKKMMQSTFRLSLVIVSLILFWVGWPVLGTISHRWACWEIQEDQGLRLWAERYKNWHEKRWVTDEDYLWNTHPSSAHYLAWYGPKTKIFWDHRFKLFYRQSESILKECKRIALLPAGKGNESSLPKLALPNKQIITIFDPDSFRLKSTMSFIVSSADWTILDLCGKTITIGKLSGPPRTIAFQDWDFRHRLLSERVSEAEFIGIGAIHPKNSSDLPWYATKLEDPIWTSFRHYLEKPELSADRETCQRLIDYGELTGLDRNEQTKLDLKSVAASLVTFSSNPQLGLEIFTQVPLMFLRPIYFSPPMNEIPTLVPIMAIRAARNAVNQHPMDAKSYILLGLAYDLLHSKTKEFIWCRRLPMLADLRHIQIVFALEQALILDPSQAVAHDLLTKIYSERRILDATNDHLHSLVQQQKNRIRPEMKETFQQIEEQAKGLEKQFQDRKNRFQIETKDLAAKPFQKAIAAIRYDLWQTALDEVLLPSQVVLFGVDGAKLELELMLNLGRVKNLYQEIEQADLKNQPSLLGFYGIPMGNFPSYPEKFLVPAYPWFQFLRHAGEGNYLEAERYLLEIEKYLDQIQRRAEDYIKNSRRLTLISGHTGMITSFLNYPLLHQLKIDSQPIPSIQADLRTLAGILAFESGELEKAIEHFQTALDSSGEIGDHNENSSKTDPTIKPLQPRWFAGEKIAREYLNLLRAAP